MRWREVFREHGFVVVPGLLSVEERRRYLHAALRAASVPPAIFRAGNGLRHYRHGALAGTADLWDLLTHAGVVGALRDVLGDSLVCLPGIDTLGVNASETEPHRDASPHELPSYGADGQRYGLARVILYPGAAETRLGVLTASHRRSGRVADLLAGQGDMRWLTLTPEDVVLFDPRLIHAGGGVEGPRVMLIATYGVDNTLTTETYFHARYRTAGLGFTDPPAAFADRLRRHDLMLEAAADPSAHATYQKAWASPSP